MRAVLQVGTKGPVLEQIGIDALHGQFLGGWALCFRCVNIASSTFDIHDNPVREGLQQDRCIFAMLGCSQAFTLFGLRFLLSKT